MYLVLSLTSNEPSRVHVWAAFSLFPPLKSTRETNFYCEGILQNNKDIIGYDYDAIIRRQ